MNSHPLEPLLTSLLSRSSAHPRRTLLLLSLITLLLGAGLFNLRFETGLLDWLPASNPDVQAFDRVVEEVDSVTNQELLRLELDPDKAAQAGVSSITDEVAIRAQEELASFVQERVPEISHVIGLPLWVKLANYTSSGAEPDTFVLPESSAEFALYWRGIAATQEELLQITVSEDEQTALLNFVIEGDPLAAGSRQVGSQFAEALEDYANWEGKRFDVLETDNLTPVGLASGIGSIDTILRRDLLLLAPLASLLLVAFLGLAFRRVNDTLAALALLLTALIWTFGAVGWLGVPLNIVNVTLFPLVLGVGIDYAVHVLNAYKDVRGQADAEQEVAKEVASRTGVALLMATLITVAGLCALTLSGVPGMVELSIFAALSMVFLLTLALTLLPALKARLPSGPAPVPSQNTALANLMTFLGKRWQLSASILVGLTLLALLGLGDTTYQTDAIQGNYPADDPFVRATEQIASGTGGAFPEFVIFQGDLTTSEFLAYTRALETALRSSETGLGAGTTVVGPSRLLGSYEVLKDGVAPALRRYLANGGSLEEAAPTDAEAVQTAYEEMHESPAWAPLIQLVSSPTLDTGVLVVVPSAATSFEEVQELRRGLENAVAATAAQRPPNVTTNILGYRTLTALFIQTSLFWMRVLFFVALAAAVLLVWLFTRSWRATLTVSLVMTVSGVWWLALLSVFDIYISIFLIFPLVFMVSAGSDYAVHLVWGLEVRDRERTGRAEVYATVGKAVLYSALTSAAVFGVFASSYLVSVSQVMLAVVLVVVTTLLCTVLSVPLVMRGAGSSSREDS